MGVRGYDRNITPFLKNSNPLELYFVSLSELGTCGTAAKGVGVPMFEERARVGVQEACEPPKSIGRAVRPMMMVPTGHLALVFVAMHVRGNANDGLMDVAVAETAAS